MIWLSQASVSFCKLGLDSPALCPCSSALPCPCQGGHFSHAVACSSMQESSFASALTWLCYLWVVEFFFFLLHYTLLDMWTSFEYVVHDWLKCHYVAHDWFWTEHRFGAGLVRPMANNGQTERQKTDMKDTCEHLLCKVSSSPAERWTKEVR